MKLQRLFSNLSVIAIALFTCTAIFCCKSPDKGKNIRVTMEIGLDDFLREKSNDPDDTVLNAAINRTLAARNGNDTPFVTLFGAIIQRQNTGVNLAKLFVKPTQSEIGVTSDNEAVIKALTHQADDAITRTYKIMENRIGLVNKDRPKLEIDAKKGLIKAEFKGDFSLERLNAFILSRGELLFMETYKNEEFAPFLIAFNDKLAALDSAADSRKESRPKKSELANKDTASLTHYVAEGKKNMPQISDQMDEDAKRKNPLFAVLSPNIDQANGTFMNGPMVGYVLKNDLPKLQKILADKRLKDVLPARAKLVFGAEEKPKKNKKPSDILPVYAVRYPDDGTPVLDGSCVTKARADFDQLTDQPNVTIDMDLTGARRWKQLTTKNVGNYIALVYDQRVFSCPRVDGPIESASTQISGSFTVEEANDMARLLMSGKLPIGVRIVETNLTENQPK